MKEWICSHCGSSTNSKICGSCQQNSVLKERYALAKRIGNGGTAESWKAYDKQENQWVAIKEMPWRVQEGSKLQERFFREADFLRQMVHPSIPTYIDHFITKSGRRSTLHIVQQFIDGQSLLDEMRHRRYSKDEVWDVAEELLSILEYIHGLAPAIIHRDIKPSNIIRNNNKKLVLIDFGSARDILTEFGLGASTISGTFGYMSPEQIQGYATPKSDLYSVGALLVHLLTRKAPNELTDHQLTIHWQEHCRLTPALELFLQRLIAADSNQRMNSAQSAKRLLKLARDPKSNFEQEAKELLQPEVEISPPTPKRKKQHNLARPTLPSDEPVEQAPNDVLPTPDVLLGIPSHRRGWWKVRPPSPPELRARPTHPATQLLLMSTGIFACAIAIQLLMVVIF